MLSKVVRYFIVLLVIVSLNFLIPRLMPGDPIMNLLGEEAFYGSAEVLEELRVELGLDGSLYAQYVRYLGNLSTGDWGYSYLYMRPVLNSITLHLRWTLILVLPSIMIGASIATFFGALAAWYRKSRLDVALSSMFLFFYSMPHYWLAMMLLFLFGFQLDWFPLGKVSGGSSGLPYILDVGWHMVLPLVALTTFKASYDFLIVRNSVVSIYGEDYILMAHASSINGFSNCNPSYLNIE